MFLQYQTKPKKICRDNLQCYITENELNQGIVFNSSNKIKQIEYVPAISKIIQFVSRISNNRFCIFSNSQAVMENLLKSHSSFYVN